MAVVDFRNMDMVDIKAIRIGVVVIARNIVVALIRVKVIVVETDFVGFVLSTFLRPSIKFKM